MTLFFILEITSVILMVALIIKNDHLRKRDTVESVKIFRIALLTAIGAVMNIVSTLYNNGVLSDLKGDQLILAAIPVALFSCIKELMSLQIMVGWNLFVDYGIYKSQDHMLKKQKQSLIPCIVLSAVFLALYTYFDTIVRRGGLVLALMSGFRYIYLIFQILYVINAILIVREAKGKRTPPTFLRIDLFIIPVAMGYVLSFIPFFWEYDYRSICMSVAVILTWRSVENRYKYIDPFTGFYNRDFLSSMNEYMEKSGYPNGIGIYFKAEGSGGKLIPVIDSLKPEDAEIFSMGEDEYLLMAGMQKESVIRLLIKSVRLKAAENLGPVEIESSYAIRKNDESTADFTGRLLELSGGD